MTDHLAINLGEGPKLIAIEASFRAQSFRPFSTYQLVHSECVACKPRTMLLRASFGKFCIPSQFLYMRCSPRTLTPKSSHGLACEPGGDMLRSTHASI